MARELGKFPQVDSTYPMMLQENRLKSFQPDWPFKEECNCTPLKMAEAGLYHTPTDECPDAVVCFTCLKELDGWEPTDDPWNEHRKHTVEKKRDCEFMKIGKKQSDLTVEEFLRIQRGRHEALMQFRTKELASKFEEDAATVKKELQKLSKTIKK